MNEKELARAPPSWSLARVITSSRSASAPSSLVKATYRTRTDV